MSEIWVAVESDEGQGYLLKVSDTMAGLGPAVYRSATIAQREVVFPVLCIFGTDVSGALNHYVNHLDQRLVRRDLFSRVIVNITGDELIEYNLSLARTHPVGDLKSISLDMFGRLANFVEAK